MSSLFDLFPAPIAGSGPSTPARSAKASGAGQSSARAASSPKRCV